MSTEHLAPRAADVTARLTDPRTYTGTHKQRFDEEGHGRGMAGRKDLVEYDGNTTSAHRGHVPFGSDQDLRERVDREKPIVRSKSRESDIGVTAKKIKIFEYAERYSHGEDIVLNKSYPSIDKLREHAATLIPPGIPKVIVDQNLREITTLDDMENGGKYLALTPHDRAHFSEERVPTAFRK
ncbi:uncharacterized protein SPPG_06588 [Spizellomyces punctatus DAOM BR117]|uniref:Doublecortin domain-containing protein n=1 Tax=Spizellomyces punctatus (strain DAOM BR117) TaxID=645134 RepID=A0A0L0H9G5_SPIPD|nr:uncharacterized protein SPPG_06588 [Spizellomyces punctatus DAOM BR117]KNC98185.1 hypothetical protein SPPG_06588 [Spizellomyces punctatus DAOM BR117]|eukprot:XP_016606225.1 hypothetical protein SPPG_06588 [Spizellomyces punctatus DAOM BR117]